MMVSSDLVKQQSRTAIAKSEIEDQDLKIEVLSCSFRILQSRRRIPNSEIEDEHLKLTVLCR
jgi:hypothetical protein